MNAQDPKDVYLPVYVTQYPTITYYITYCQNIENCIYLRKSYCNYNWAYALFYIECIRKEVARTVRPQKLLNYEEEPYILSAKVKSHFDLSVTYNELLFV